MDSMLLVDHNLSGTCMFIFFLSYSCHGLSLDIYDRKMLDFLSQWKEPSKEDWLCSISRILLRFPLSSLQWSTAARKGFGVHISSNTVNFDSPVASDHRMIYCFKTGLGSCLGHAKPYHLDARLNNFVPRGSSVSEARSGVLNAQCSSTLIRGSVWL